MELDALTTCPKCNYQRTGSETAPSYECPACGVVYSKYLQAIESGYQPAPRRPADAADEQLITPPEHPPAPSPDPDTPVTPSLRDHIATPNMLVLCAACDRQVSRHAAWCPGCGHPINAAPHITVADVQMRFFSIMLLMVKSAFAAIPAAIIITTIVVVVGATLLGFSTPSKAQQVFRCQLDGRTVFSDRPCAPDAEAVTTRPAAGEYDRSAGRSAEIRTQTLQRQQALEDIDREAARIADQRRMAAEQAAERKRCEALMKQHADALYWSKEFRHPDNVRRERDKANLARERAFFECGKILETAR